MRNYFSCFYLPEDIKAGKPEAELRVAASEGRFGGEGWRVKKDGARFWASVSITAIRDQTGSLRGYAKMARDIGVGEKVEPKYSGSGEVEAEALIIADLDGRIVLVNARAEELFGYARFELIEWESS